MARKHKARVAYRDKVTGRFVSRATWKRSKARGGERYKRVNVTTGIPARSRKRNRTSTRPKSLSSSRIKDREDREIYDEIEFQGAFDSPGGKSK